MSSSDASMPLETTVKEKVRKMSFLQSELEYVVSSGLASETRNKWLVDKLSLEEQKRICKEQWQDLEARQQTTTDAFDQLASKTGFLAMNMLLSVDEESIFNNGGGGGGGDGLSTPQPSDRGVGEPPLLVSGASTQSLDGLLGC